MSLSMKKELFRGFAINFVAKYSNVFIQFIIGAILARILSPKEFGIVAVVMVFAAFFNLLAYMGIGPAVIQHKGLNKGDINHIFIATIFFGGVISTAFFFSAFAIANFFNDPVYLGITQLLAISIFFFSLSIIPKSLASKEKKFKLIGMIDVSVNTVIGVATIILALKGFSYYAIIIKTIATSFFSFIIYYIFSGIELKGIIYSQIGGSVKKVLRFSVFQSLFDVINYFTRNLDNLFIGKFLGDVQLGYYDIAYKFMMYPISNFTHVLTPVMLPVFKDYQDEPKMIYKYYGDIAKLLSVVGVIASVMIFFMAEELIIIVYGDQWIKSVVVFRILATTIGLQMVLSSSGSIFQVLGRTKELFISGLIGASIMLVSFTLGIIVGTIEAVSFGFALGFAINFFAAYYILIVRVFKESYYGFLKNFIKSLVIGIIMIVFLSVSLLFDIEQVFVSFLFKSLLSLVGIVIGILASGTMKDIRRLMKK